MCSCDMIMWVLFLFCFFFKQKTAYEMRISDWSSDVCSSDLVSGSSLIVPNSIRVCCCQDGLMVSVAHGSGLEAAHPALSGRAAPMRATRLAGILLGLASISTLPKGYLTPCRTHRRTRDPPHRAPFRRQSAPPPDGTHENGK